MSRTTRKSAIIAVLAMVLGLLTPLVTTAPASALSGSDFDPGNIISDANFYNGSAMTEAEIQRFLSNAVGGVCNNSNCLANYRADTPTRTWSFGTCSTYQGGVAESAARIIFKVQQACNLSAKVILVTLQKEQSLVTDRAPSDGVMRKAMGYGCPDTDVCDSTYYGFFNQIFAAGRQLTWYSNPAGSFTSIKVGQYNWIRYSPNADCGSKSVLVKNRATAALYYYTPYTPNAAALANLGGLGDACSAYGNRNFWVFYNNWFGPPAGGKQPIGNIEEMSAVPGGLKISGWALDLDSTDSIAVHVYIDGIGTAISADRERPDVAAAYGLGAAHGFSATVPALRTGSQNVCVYAIDRTGDGPSLFTCRTMTLWGGSPVGAMSASMVDGKITVTGWAIDPDVVDPIQVHVYVDSAGVALTANRASAEAAAKYPAYGNAHGFKTSMAASPGTHNVCVYGINVKAGTNSLLGCTQVAVIGEQGRAPFGSFDSIAPDGSGGIRVTGWAIDPDTTQPIAVHAYVDAVGTAFVADGSRPDVAAAFPGYGDKHGFDKKLTASPGTHTVCLYAINTGAGGHSALGCAAVTIAGAGPSELGRAPIGNLEVVDATASAIRVTGWAIDPDTVASIKVHLYVDSTGVEVVANLDRGDVAAAYPVYGASHGFQAELAASPGSHQVCAYAINTGSGGHSALGCRTVTVTGAGPDLGRAPVGNLESVTAAPGSVTVSGWALDPDTNSSISVHIYVDSAGTAITANGPRPDVAVVYPGLGEQHGFAASIPAAAGGHSVCAYAINTGAGGHTLIGCRSINVP